MQPALTRVQLKEIQDAFRKAPKVLAALREIKRLRDTSLELYDLSVNADTVVLEQARAALQRIHQILDYEPCVAERAFDEWQAKADPITLKRNTSPRSPRYRWRVDK